MRCRAGDSRSRSTPRANWCPPFEVFDAVSQGKRRNGSRGRLLLARQDAHVGGVRHRAVRHDGPGNERLAAPWRRPRTLAGTVRALRRGAFGIRQLRRADGRLVQQGDQLRGRHRRHEDAHPGPRRRGVPTRRRGCRIHAGQRDLHGAADRRGGRDGVGRTVQRPGVSDCRTSPSTTTTPAGTNPARPSKPSSTRRRSQRCPTI